MRTRKQTQRRDVYSSMPQEQRPANLPAEEPEMEVVQEQEQQAQGQGSNKRRKNNPHHPFVAKGH